MIGSTGPRICPSPSTPRTSAGPPAPSPTGRLVSDLVADVTLADRVCRTRRDRCGCRGPATSSGSTRWSSGRRRRRLRHDQRHRRGEPRRLHGVHREFVPAGAGRAVHGVRRAGRGRAVAAPGHCRYTRTARWWPTPPAGSWSGSGTARRSSRPCRRTRRCATCGRWRRCEPMEDATRTRVAAAARRGQPGHTTRPAAPLRVETVLGYLRAVGGGTRPADVPPAPAGTSRPAPIQHRGPQPGVTRPGRPGHPSVLSGNYVSRVPEPLPLHAGRRQLGVGRQLPRELEHAGRQQPRPVRLQDHHGGRPTDPGPAAGGRQRAAQRRCAEQTPR